MKMSYEYVSKELDKVYEKEFDESDVEGINKHCEFIQAFIEACGWDSSEYIQAMVEAALPEVFQNNPDQDTSYWDPDFYPNIKSKNN